MTTIYLFKQRSCRQYEIFMKTKKDLNFCIKKQFWQKKIYEERYLINTSDFFS